MSEKETTLIPVHVPGRHAGAKDALAVVPVIETNATVKEAALEE
jgi:hypothetical protein